MSAKRPELTAPLDTPEFVAWAASRTVEDHLANARQVVELANYGLCPESVHCMHCSAARLHLLGIRQRLAAIAGLLVVCEPMHPHAELLLGRSVQLPAALSGVVSHDGAAVRSSTDPDTASAVESTGDAHTSTSAAELFDSHPYVHPSRIYRSMVGPTSPHTAFAQRVEYEITTLGRLAGWEHDTDTDTSIHELTRFSGHQAEAKRTDAPASDGQTPRMCICGELNCRFMLENDQ